MKIVIIINNARLTPELKSKLLRPDLTEKYGIQYDTFFPEANEIAATLKNINFQTYNACLVGGGDGTVRSIVEAMYDKNIPLVILPLGTFNLLAKSLNYPDTIEAVFEIIKNNKAKQMDVVFVNDLLVMNHAWIGFYYYILKERKKHRAIIGKNRLKKIIFNTIFLLKKLPIYQLAFKANQQDFQYKTCLVFISNNESYLNFTDFGEHKSLATGLIHIIILNCQSRLSLLQCLLSMLFGYKNTKYFIEFTTDQMTIESKKNEINLVIDGELMKTTSPIHVINHSKKLTVLTP